MLILHLLSSLLLYFLAKKLSGSSLAGLLSVLFFSLSPLAVYFHRRVLLDNIMVFWLLLSIVVLIYNLNRGRGLLVSGILFGVSVLTKEVALLFLPVLVYLIYVLKTNELMKGITHWVIGLSVVILGYVLFAFARGELFPFQSGNSLVSSVLYQVTRSSGEGSFMDALRLWVNEDPITVGLGILTIILNFIVGYKYLSYRLIALLTLPIFIYYLRGGLVYEFYIIAALPFIAINLAFFVYLLIVRARSRYLKYLCYASVVVIFAGWLLYYSNNSKESYSLFTSNQTLGQRQSVDWLINNTKPDSKTVIDSFGYVDLNSASKETGRRFDYYWKVDADTIVREEVYKDSSLEIDYVALTPQMERDIRQVSSLRLTREAVIQGDVISSFWSDGWGVDIIDNIQNT